MEYERIREEMADLIWQCEDNYEAFPGDHACSGTEFNKEKFLGKVLSIKGIRIEADNQDKPQNPYAEAADRGDMYAQSRCSGYYCAQDDMLTPKDGDVWVKCKVKEE